ncbi:MAG TPA: hypothetical protein PLN69_09985 [bacterium]|nr:hypothetical protein [bacterium]
MIESNLTGYWRITEMEMWDSNYLDMEVESYIKFEDNGTGEFQFGLIHGWIDGDFTAMDEKPAVEFSWEGNDEMDPASGRGWAMLEDDITLSGEIFFHMGDGSGFTATRENNDRKTNE